MALYVVLCSGIHMNDIYAVSFIRNVIYRVINLPSVKNKSFKLGVVLLNAVMLNVVAPLNLLCVHSPNFFKINFTRGGGRLFLCRLSLLICFRFKVRQPFYGVFCKHPLPLSRSKSCKLTIYC
jgi:hypothetical protein